MNAHIRLPGVRATDVQITNHGTMFFFWPKNDKARQWVDENIPLESWQWHGDEAFAVDGRYALDLAQGMIDAGLEVR